MTTFCKHGISHQPGEADSQGRSEWCGECWPSDSDSDDAWNRVADQAWREIADVFTPPDPDCDGTGKRAK